MLGLGLGHYEYLPYLYLRQAQRYGHSSFARRYLWIRSPDGRSHTGANNHRPSRAMPRQFRQRHLQHCLHRLQFSRHSDRPNYLGSHSYGGLLCHKRSARKRSHCLCDGFAPDMVCQCQRIAVGLVRPMRTFMSREHNSSAFLNRKSQAGLSLLETMIALAILLLVSAGIMGLATIATSTTETQGHLASRTTEYAQDKMEQLLGLKFCDGPTNGTDTTVFPAVVNAGGTGLAGCNNPGGNPPTALSGGSLSPAAPVTGYVDYLDASGNLVAGTANWEYIRLWQISVPTGSSGLKQISVLAQARYTVGKNGIVPQSTVVALKTFPF